MYIYDYLSKAKLLKKYQNLQLRIYSLMSPIQIILSPFYQEYI